MQSLPLYDLNTSSEINFEFLPNDFYVLLLFSSKDFTLLKEFSKEQKTPSWNPISAYIGSEIPKLKQYIKKEILKTSIYHGGEDLENWNLKGISETP